MWPGLALTIGQLAVMGTSLTLSLSLGYAGGLASVGTVTSAMLVFQLTSGTLQRSLAEATLLATSHAGRRADIRECRWSVTTALGGACLGGVAAALSSLTVTDARADLAIIYAVGIPFAIALDIGRSAGVAALAPRSALVESAAWLTVQMALAVLFALLHSPMGICLSWMGVNVTFFVITAVLQIHRRPALNGIADWFRRRRGLMGTASLDALLVGLAPVLAMQVTTFVATAETLGSIRVLQQVLGPLAFLSITFRRVLIYRRRAEVATTALTDLRDGLLAMALMAAGAALLGATVVAGRELLPEFAFIPAGLVLVAAGMEKAALGLSYGCSLSRFIRGEFTALLHARYVMLAITAVAAPIFTLWWGAAGYLVGSSSGMIIYSVAVLILPNPKRRQPYGLRAEAVEPVAVNSPGRR